MRCGGARHTGLTGLDVTGGACGLIGCNATPDFNLRNLFTLNWEAWEALAGRASESHAPLGSIPPVASNVLGIIVYFGLYIHNGGHASLPSGTYPHAGCCWRIRQAHWTVSRIQAMCGLHRGLVRHSSRHFAMEGTARLVLVTHSWRLLGCLLLREDASPYMLAKDFGWVPILASPSCRTDYIQRGRLSSEGCCSMAAIHSPLKRAFIHSSAASTGSATLSPSRKVVVVIHSVIRGPVTYGAPTFKANSSGKEGCNAGCNFIANLQSEDRSRSIPEAY